jgi:hypothetical protein
MAIHVQFSERDLARGILVSPDWYRVRIDDVTPQESKDKQSINYVMEGTVICNANDGAVDFAGAVIVWNFNSKAPGFMQGLFKALIGPDAKLTPNERYDLEATKGKEVDMLIENSEWQGRLINRVNHRYRYPNQG